MAKKIFSGLDALPNGDAPDRVTPGCLVLEGGAFRALYGEGVLDAMMEAGINLECTIGVSAGAMNGMNYVSGQIGRAARINLHYRHFSRYVSYLGILTRGGVINFDFVLKNVPNDPFNAQRFYRPDRRFYAVATNCLTGETAYFEKSTCSDIFRAVQASASMPYVSRMVKLDGIPYLDGGCSTKIACQWALDQQFDKIVIVRTRHNSFRYPCDKVSSMPYRFYRKYPDFAKVLAGSEERYNHLCDSIEQLGRDGRAFVISPSHPMEIGRLEKDMEKLGDWYYLGYQDGQDNLEALRAYLGN